MPNADKERDERFALAVAAIDEALESDDPNVALQAAIGWALIDISDSLDVLAQSVEKPATRASRRPPKPKPARKRARKGADEEDE